MIPNASDQLVLAPDLSETSPVNDEQTMTGDCVDQSMMDPPRKIPDDDQVVEFVTEDGGVRKMIVHHGCGDQVVPLHATCLVHYVGRILSTGDVFMDTLKGGGDDDVVQSSVQREPVKLVAGRDAIMKENGLHQAVATMKVGEICHVWVTPEYGYGESGNFSFPSIPPSAHLSYAIQLVDFEPPPKSQDDTQYDTSSLTYEERLEAATRRRLDGNEQYSHGHVEHAMTKYTSALAFLDDDFIMQLYEFHYDKAMDEKTAILLNIAACHMKKKSYWGVIEATSQVLAHDGGNIKALFRRGSARRALGQTQEGLEDLMRAKTLSEKSGVDPGILREIAAAKREMREQHKTQGSLYKAMMMKSSSFQDAERDVSQKEETNTTTNDTSRDGQPPPMAGSSRTTAETGKIGTLIYEWCIRVLEWISRLVMSRKNDEMMNTKNE